MAKYVIGVDFGTLSARAILINVETGEAKLRLSEQPYAHAVIRRCPAARSCRWTTPCSTRRTTSKVSRL